MVYINRFGFCSRSFSAGIAFIRRRRHRTKKPVNAFCGGTVFLTWFREIARHRCRFRFFLRRCGRFLLRMEYLQKHPCNFFLFHGTAPGLKAPEVFEYSLNILWQKLARIVLIKSAGYHHGEVAKLQSRASHAFKERICKSEKREGGDGFAGGHVV